jgi:hypothetical protein
MSNYSDPVARIVAVTPNDSADLANGPSRGLYLGTGGDVVLQDTTGTQVTLSNMAGGVCHPIGARRILATGTTATGIRALY